MNLKGGALPEDSVILPVFKEGHGNSCDAHEIVCLPGSNFG